MSKPTILFLCIGNSIRSQMAEGFMREYGSDKFECLSAGTSPSLLHPMTVRVMKEKGIDISDHTSKSVSDINLKKVSMIMTLCGEADEVCPILHIQVPVHQWHFPDPVRGFGREEIRLQKFREVRDGIEKKVKEFLKQS